MQRAVQNKMITHQMDVKTAYLNGPIDCDIYMEQPEGFQKVGKNGKKLVCKLKKSLVSNKMGEIGTTCCIPRYIKKIFHSHMLIHMFT